MKTLLAAVLLTSLAGTSAAFSADLPVIVPDVEMVDTSSDWSGLFIGAHVGYASGVVEWATLPTGLFTGDYGIAGWLAGAQVGYNHQMDSLVIGGDLNLEWTGIEGVDDVGGGAIAREINWAGSLRGRLGFAVESVLIYGTAGLAFANSTGYSVGASVDTQTHLGWTVGLGFEAMVSDNLSLFAEYDYTSYNEMDYDYLIDTATSFDTHAIKVGANWHF